GGGAFGAAPIGSHPRHLLFPLPDHGRHLKATRKPVVVERLPQGHPDRFCVPSHFIRQFPGDVSIVPPPSSTPHEDPDGVLVIEVSGLRLKGKLLRPGAQSLPQRIRPSSRHKAFHPEHDPPSLHRSFLLSASGPAAKPAGGAYLPSPPHEESRRRMGR